MAGDKRPSLDEFIASEIAEKKIRRCKTCTHPDVEAVNDALRKRDEGADGYTLSAIGRWAGIPDATIRHHAEEGHYRGE